MRLIRAIGLAVAVLSTSGCGSAGPTSVRVWGEVTYDGKPIDEGKITLTPTGETPGGSVAGVIKEGRYDIPSDEGPLAGGTYRVEISSLAKKGKALPNVVDPGGPSLAVFEELIPPAYNRDSTLTMSVAADNGQNQFDFKLARSAP